MIQKLKEDLFDKISNNATVAIFGASKPQELLYNDLKKYRPDVNVSCFIDNFVSDNTLEKPIYTLKQFTDNNEKCDFVIIMTSRDIHDINGILRTYGYNTIIQTGFIKRYYRDKLNFNKSEFMSMFETKEDFNLYTLLNNTRMKYIDKTELENWYDNTYCPEEMPYIKLDKQYVDKINKEAVKVIFDLGFNSGTNAIPFMRFLPNLEKIYGFEATYDICKTKWIEDFFIDSGKVEIVDYAVGEKNGTIDFYIDNINPTASFSKDISTKNRLTDNMQLRKVNVINIDSFVKDRNIKVDLIKMDIEGAELSAIKGAMETIKTQRPQLAVSIYHSMNDFTNIPLYLKNNLSDYTYRIGHYGKKGKLITHETVLYAIPKELAK